MSGSYFYIWLFRGRKVFAVYKKRTPEESLNRENGTARVNSFLKKNALLNALLECRAQYNLHTRDTTTLLVQNCLYY